MRPVVVYYRCQASYLVMATPDEHKYVTMWKSVETKKFWSFSVRAGGDVHVVLTSRLGQTDSDLYELVIGGWSNSASVIRTEVIGGGDSVKAMLNRTNLVTATEFRHFWISWYDGLVSVGISRINIYYQFYSWQQTGLFVRTILFAVLLARTGLVVRTMPNVSTLHDLVNNNTVYCF